MKYIDPIAKLLGNWSSEINIYSMILRLLIVIILTATVGYERSSKRHSAGLRTFVLISFFIMYMYVARPIYGNKDTISFMCDHNRYSHPF